MQEKKILQIYIYIYIYIERERERERERENIFLRENYANNGRENEKFIVKWCEYEEIK